MIDIEQFEKDLTVFASNQHHIFVTYSDHIKQHGYTIEDVRAYIKFKQQQSKESEMQLQKKNAVIEKMMPPCTECSKSMFLRGIQIPKGPQNVHGYKTCFECPECGHEIYSKDSISTALKKLRREGFIKET